MTRPTVCEGCGTSNPVDASFCDNCHAFLGWDRTTAMQTVGTAAPDTPIHARTMPKVPGKPQPSGRPAQPRDDRPAQPSDEPAPVLAVRVEQDGVTVPLTGEPAELTLAVTNLSDFVDGYEVDVAGAPGWLRVESDPLRLLPDDEERLVVRFWAESRTTVPAGRSTVELRVRSLTQPPAHEIVPVAVTMPVVDAPVTVRTEPSVVRIRDVEVGRFELVVDNAAANRPARIRLSGTDPELAVGFRFDPDVAVIGPGESIRVRAVATAPLPKPGTEMTRTLTVSASEDKRRVDTVVSLVQATSAVVEDPMVELTAAPSLVRLRDGETRTVRVGIDNRGGRRWATVRLSATDAEHVVYARWTATEVRVPPGRTAEVEVQLSGAAPEPGTEVTRTVTVSATDGRRTARTQLSMVHAANASPMTTLAVQLDPSVLRLGNSRRGTSSVVVDNRSGRLPVRVWLQGDDPENAVTFGFAPGELSVPAGQALASRVTVTTPRAPVGRETDRHFTIAATDGFAGVKATGTIIQSAASRRPWARVVLTLLGGLAMILGALRPVLAAGSENSFDVNVNVIAGLFGASVNLAGFEQLVTFGLVILVLAGLMLFGLTGTSGRLTRFTALIAVLLTVALLIVLALVGIDPMPGGGAVLIILGCVLGYIGGLLARRR